MLRVTIGAFLINEANIAAAQGLQEIRAISRSKISVHTGGLQESISYLGSNETPQVLIVETDASGENLFQALEGLAEVCAPEAKVILIGADNDIELYRRLTAMGLSEYYYGTISSDQLAEAIEGFFTEADAAQLGRVISFIGARGGVGSSTIAANTAYCLANQLEENVILIDLDLAFGTAAVAYNLQQKQSIVDALAQPGRLDDVLMARFMLKVDDHLSVVPAPSNLGGNFGIQLEAFEVLLKLVRQMVPYVVLDLPHQWQPWINEVLMDSSDLVITAYPDLISLRDAKNFFDALSQPRGTNVPTRLVLNRVGLSKKTELSGKDFLGAIGTSPAITIPYDPIVFGTALNNGQMVVQANKRSKPAKEFGALATLVSGKEPADSGKKSSFSFLKSSK